MKKIFTALLATFLGCIFMFAFVGCKESATVEHITDISYYSGMKKRADRIEVNYDNGTQAGFKFTVTDKSDLNDIMEIIFSDTLNDLGEQSKPPMGNTSITVYQGGKSYGMGDRFITAGGRLYAFSTSNLHDKIYKLAVKHGAYS